MTAAAITASYVLFALVWGADEAAVRALMLAGVAFCGAFLLAKRLLNKKALTTETIVFTIIAAGIVMRIGYMLYTPFSVRDYDVSTFDSNGHFAYMYRLFSQGALPSSNDYQFYHPPFQHIIQALVVKIFSFFQPNAELTPLFEAAKLVPCFASCALLWVCRSLFREAGLPKRAGAVALAIVAFHPAFYMLSSRVNNDALMLFFFMTSVLYTIRWYNRPTMNNILLIAVSIGLAMMTKLSGGMAALFTAPVFLTVLVKKWREREAKSVIGQFAVFGAVCAPLGLWYSVRNLVLFGQPLGYVLKFANTSGLYCGDKSLVSRFLSIPLGQIINPLYCYSFGDYNLWLYILKSSLFGEFSFDRNGDVAAVLIISNLVMILASFAAMIYVMARGKEMNKFARYGFFWIWLTQMIAFFAFNLQYPFGCTMDFRYMMPTAIIGAGYIGLALDRIGKRTGVLPGIVCDIGLAVVVIFCAASVLFFAL